jgi:nitroreductase
MSPAPRRVAAIPDAHRLVLTEALRAPSAHNAQPWRLAVAPEGYELHYNHLDYLPYDPDDRDAYLAIGAFCETLELAAHRHGMRASVTYRFDRRDNDLLVGVIRLREQCPGELADPLALSAAQRRTNRHPYDRTPLPDPLRAQLAELGCVLVPPRAIARLVARASTLSWKDPRFVADLGRWTSADPDAPAGMTPAGLPLTRFEWSALRLAIRARRLSAPVALAYSSREIRLLARAQAVAVMGAADMSAVTLVNAGRRLLRCWVTITAAGFAYHPISVAVDRPETAPDVAAEAGVRVPVAVFRIGHPRQDAPLSNRRSLDDVLAGPAHHVKIIA